MRMQSGLPAGVSALVGRGHERAAVADMVTASRVVTVTGAAGCGKTRLALEVARDVAPRFTDGTCWVSLQSVSDPEFVVAAVAGAVQAHERPGQELYEALTEHLGGRQLLVVLDNCEHVVDACAALVAALSSACPQVHVLATSRVPLVVDGEATFGVPSLAVPAPGARSSSTVAAADAARLFEVRSRQVVADFRIDDDNAAAVAEICRRLDGIPLAIELAAARVRVLAPAQIATRLSDRFRLLTGGPRESSDRQRTLEASLDWSYELLDEVQRLALARLSVFAGSFELDAAEAVVSDESIDSNDVLDLVAALAQQSMVEVVERDPRARYRLLETIRVYARERLAELDQPARVRDRHLDFHVELATRARAGLNGREPEPWMRRLAADLDDLRAASDRAVEVGDLRALVALTEPVVRFWFERGPAGEAHRRLHDATAVLAAPADVRVRALTTAAALALAAGRPADAHTSASHAVDAARAAGADGPLAVALGQRAWSGATSGLSTREQVDADTEQALVHADRCEEASTQAYVLAFVAGAVFCSRSIGAGTRLLERALEVCEANGLVLQAAAVHASLGAGLGPGPEWSGAVDRSSRQARRAVELGRGVGRPGCEAWGLTGLGAAAVLRGEQDRAKAWLDEARAVLEARAPAASHHVLTLRHWLALAACASGDLDALRATALEIVRAGRGGGSRWDESIGEWLLAVDAHGRGHDHDARSHLEAAHVLSSEPPLPWPLGRSLLGLAELAVQDDPDAAWELAHDGLEVLDDYGDRVGTATALETVAGVAVALGEPTRALRLLGASQRFHTDRGIARFPIAADGFERARSAAGDALDLGEATACFEEGADLSLEEAVAYARRGRGERQRPSTGWGSLTPVERDVVRLVAEGGTNAEIGRRLFISVNTVKKHLSHVYAKLGIDGRAGLAAQAVHRGLGLER